MAECDEGGMHSLEGPGMPIFGEKEEVDGTCYLISMLLFVVAGPCPSRHSKSCSNGCCRVHLDVLAFAGIGRSLRCQLSATATSFP